MTLFKAGQWKFHSTDDFFQFKLDVILFVITVFKTKWERCSLKGS